MDVIRINDLSFGYNKHMIFDKFNLKVKAGSFTTIIGNNGSGKSTLLKLILGLNKSTGIFVFDKPLNDNKRFIRKNIGVVFSHPRDYFIFETVKEELLFSSIDVEESQREKKVLEVLKKLDINYLLNKKIVDLTDEEAAFVAFASVFCGMPQLIIIDNVLSIIKSDIVLKLLKELNNNGVTIVNLTTNEEELLYGSHVIILDNGERKFFGTIKKLIYNIDVLHKYNIEYPFIIDLSEKLEFYNLITQKYTNMEKLVNDLWKN